MTISGADAGTTTQGAWSQLAAPYLESHVQGIMLSIAACTASLQREQNLSNDAEQTVLQASGQCLPDEYLDGVLWWMPPHTHRQTEASRTDK
jgi:hypothetical protein